MAKNRTKKSAAENVDVTPPVVVSMDVLADATDFELRSRGHNLEAEMRTAIHAGYDSYLWEVELAYVQREMGIRNTRMRAHEQYLLNNPEELEAFSGAATDDDKVLN